MAARTMTVDELLTLPLIIPIKDAARALGIGENRARDMAREDGAMSSAVTVAPCRVGRDGREFKVSRFDLFRSLGLDPVSGAQDPAMVGAPTVSQVNAA